MNGNLVMASICNKCGEIIFDSNYRNKHRKACPLRTATPEAGDLTEAGIYFLGEVFSNLDLKYSADEFPFSVIAAMPTKLLVMGCRYSRGRKPHQLAVIEAKEIKSITASEGKPTMFNGAAFDEVDDHLGKRVYININLWDQRFISLACQTDNWHRVQKCIEEIEEIIFLSDGG